MMFKLFFMVFFLFFLLEMSNRTKELITADMSDEQVAEFMDSVESENDSADDSDDSVRDPDYEPDEIQLQVRHGMNNAMENIQQSGAIDDSETFLQGLNISPLENEPGPAASSTYIVLDNVVLLSSPEDIEALPIVFEQPKPSTSAARTRPNQKRARSPLPTIDANGPSFTPNDGGLIGSGKNSSLYFLN